MTNNTDIRRFGLTWDYRCPYGRIAHDHVVKGLRAGANWDVTFLPFCLGQAHVEDGQSDIWDRPHDDSGIYALQFGISVRDQQAAKFLELHAALYDFRHDSHGDLKNEEMIAAIASSHGVDVAAVNADIASGRPLAIVKAEHSAYVSTHAVWGVPTFVVGNSAVFVRLLDRPKSDQEAINTIERVLDNIAWDNLNEFKHTSVPR